MRIIIRSNIYTELGICNGTVGVLKNVVYGRGENGPHEYFDNGVGSRFIVLKQMPEAIIVTLQTPVPTERDSLH